MSDFLQSEDLEMLRRCNGYYACPKHADGKRRGPLVGYAGKYDGPDGRKLQFVGDVYANFAKIEEHTAVLKIIGQRLAHKLIGAHIGLDNKEVLCAAPIGGYDLACAVGMALGCQKVKAEKKVTELAAATSREKSELVFARHVIEPGRDHVITEDVCNNFSTTEQLVSLIRSFGGNVVAIICFLNRSPHVNEQYYSPALNREIPVISLVRQVIAEWKQDDPAVLEDIRSGNVAWKPKDEWPRLMEAVARAL